MLGRWRFLFWGCHFFRRKMLLSGRVDWWVISNHPTRSRVEHVSCLNSKHVQPRDWRWVLSAFLQPGDSTWSFWWPMFFGTIFVPLFFSCNWSALPRSNVHLKKVLLVKKTLFLGGGFKYCLNVMFTPILGKNDPNLTGQLRIFQTGWLKPPVFFSSLQELQPQRHHLQLSPLLAKASHGDLTALVPWLSR